MKNVKKSIIVVGLALVLLLGMTSVVFAGDEFDPKGCARVEYTQCA